MREALCMLNCQLYDIERYDSRSTIDLQQVSSYKWH